MQNIDTQAYVVAVNRRRVGVAVTAGHGFRFIAADPEFRPLGRQQLSPSGAARAGGGAAGAGRGAGAGRLARGQADARSWTPRTASVTHGPAAG